MAVIGSLSASIRRQRIQVRLIAYGAATTLLIGSSVVGHLDRPAVPVGIALAGLLFAIPSVRLQRLLFWFAVAFDAFAIVTLALVANSLLLGGLALGVAALTLSIGKPPSTILPVGVTALVGLVVLLLVEKGLIADPTFIPVLSPPADTIAALAMTTVIAAAGVSSVRRLLTMYGLAAMRVESSTRRWWRFMEQADDPMLVTVDGLIARANGAAERLVGRPSAELQGARIDVVVTDGSRVTRADGSVREVDVVTAPLAIEGRLSEVVFMRDVSDRVEERRALERTVRETDQFVASVSHEVRTPLTAVVGLSSIVADTWDELTEGERREMVELVATESREVSAIVEDLLVAARGQTGGLRVQRAPVHLAEEVSQVLGSLHLGDVEVCGAAQALADPGRVRQIVRNLLTNAVRYGGDDVSVRIGVERDHAVLEVSDNGPPIPQPMREQIFEAFVRAASETPAGAVGLGLNVSRQLAELMGGTLTYRHDGGRSRFILSLPLTR